MKRFYTNTLDMAIVLHVIHVKGQALRIILQFMNGKEVGQYLGNGYGLL
jgi:hypothetical protein